MSSTHEGRLSQLKHIADMTERDVANWKSTIKKFKRSLALALLGTTLAFITWGNREKLHTWFADRFTFNRSTIGLHLSALDNNDADAVLRPDGNYRVWVNFGYLRGWVPVEADNLQAAIQASELEKGNGRQTILTAVIPTEVVPKHSK